VRAKTHTVFPKGWRHATSCKSEQAFGNLDLNGGIATRHARYIHLKPRRCAKRSTSCPAFQAEASRDSALQRNRGARGRVKRSGVEHCAGAMGANTRHRMRGFIEGLSAVLVSGASGGGSLLSESSRGRRSLRFTDSPLPSRGAVGFEAAEGRAISGSLRRLAAVLRWAAGL
jgi:hypothetical protein